MSSKKLLLLLFISFVASSSVVYQWRNRQGPRGSIVLPPPGASIGDPAPPESVAPVSAPSGVPAPAGDQSAASASITETGSTGTRVSIPPSGWGRNPFLTIEEINAANQPPPPLIVDTPSRTPVEPGTGLPVYVVTGIVRSPLGNRAVVDDRVLQAGDRLGQETVKEIKEGAIVLEYEGRTREVKLRRFEDALRTVPKGEKP